MQTDCLDYNHRGYLPTGGQAWRSTDQSYKAPQQNQYRGFPAANLLGKTAEFEATTTCHSGATGNSGTWPARNLWNSVTPW